MPSPSPRDASLRRQRRKRNSHGVSLCQCQTSPSSSFSPTQTSLRPAGGCHTDRLNACSRSRSCLCRCRAPPLGQSRAGAYQREQVQETPLKPVSGERNEDLHDEKESLHQHRSAPQSAQKSDPEKHAAQMYPVLGENKEDSRNLHQLRLECLFRCLRYTEDCACSAGWTHNLGHLDNLLGNTKIERREYVHQLFHHLRLDHEGHRDHRNRVGDLLHGVPLHLLLRQHLQQRCWPPGYWCLSHVPPRTSIAKYKAPAAWRRASSGTRPYSTSRAPLPSLAVVCLRGAEWWVISARGDCDG